MINSGNNKNSDNNITEKPEKSGFSKMFCNPVSGVLLIVGVFKLVENTQKFIFRMIENRIVEYVTYEEEPGDESSGDDCSEVQEYTE